MRKFHVKLAGWCWRSGYFDSFCKLFCTPLAQWAENKFHLRTFCDCDVILSVVASALCALHCNRNVPAGNRAAGRSGRRESCFCGELRKLVLTIVVYMYHTRTRNREQEKKVKRKILCQKCHQKGEEMRKNTSDRSRSWTATEQRAKTHGKSERKRESFWVNCESTLQPRLFDTF